MIKYQQMNAGNVVNEYVCVTRKAFIISILKLVYSRVNEDPTLESDIDILSLFMLLSICNPVLK